MVDAGHLKDTSMNEVNLKDISLFIMDVDGVLWAGDAPVPGTAKGINDLRNAGVALRFLTNDAVNSRRSRLEELNNNGFAIGEAELYTASYLTAQYLKQIGCPRTLLLLSGSGRDEFAGLPIVEDSPDIVVVGDFFDSYTRQAIEKAFDAVMHGAQLLAMQKNRYWMYGDHPKVDLGFWVAGLEYCTGVKAKVIAKPSVESYQVVLRDAGVQSSRAAMVSDDLYSDLSGAKRAGLATVHVTGSGSFPKSDATVPAADFTVPLLSRFIELILQGRGITG